MTAARARGSQRVRSNSERGKDQLQGLQPVVEDWHAKVCLLGVCVHSFLLFIFISLALKITVGYLEAIVQYFHSYGCGNTVSAEESDQSKKCVTRSDVQHQCKRGFFHLSRGSTRTIRMHDRVRHDCSKRQPI